jgi:hypothetical protein
MLYLPIFMMKRSDQFITNIMLTTTRDWPQLTLDDKLKSAFSFQGGPDRAAVVLDTVQVLCFRLALFA